MCLKMPAVLEKIQFGIFSFAQPSKTAERCAHVPTMRNCLTQNRNAFMPNILVCRAYQQSELRREVIIQNNFAEFQSRYGCGHQLKCVRGTVSQ